MTPELHVKRYLEEIKDKYSRPTFRTIQRSLKYYLDYLKMKRFQTVDVGQDVIQGFCELLYFGYAHERVTAWYYARAVRHFYDYLVGMRAIAINPVKPYRFKPRPLKERSYTDEEIMRAYLESWRMLIRKPSKMTQDSWRYLEEIFKKESLRLQTIDRSGMVQVASVIDQLRTRGGLLLRLKARQGALSVLGYLLRWMHHNGYHKDNPDRGFTYQFQAREPESPPSEEPKKTYWEEPVRRFLDDARVRCRPSTIRNWEHQLKWFSAYLNEQSVLEPIQITQRILEGYQARVYAKEKLSDSTKWSRLFAVRCFMRWLERTEQILINPVHRMSWPKKVCGLPTRLMSPHDVSMLMSVPDVTTPVGLRNRTTFELMYSTGLRVGEAASVTLEDIDFENGLIKVQNPKGGLEYQRVVPIGGIALCWIRRYLQEARDSFPKNKGNERLLFLTKTGRAITQLIVCGAMRQYAYKAGMRKIYSSHSWRVTCATMMLKNHADIRHVQEQLGHRSLRSTQIYTRLVPMDLKKVHEKTHPREKEYRKIVKHGLARSQIS